MHDLLTQAESSRRRAIASGSSRHSTHGFHKPRPDAIEAHTSSRRHRRDGARRSQRRPAYEARQPRATGRSTASRGRSTASRTRKRKQNAASSCSAPATIIYNTRRATPQRIAALAPGSGWCAAQPDLDRVPVVYFHDNVNADALVRKGLGGAEPRFELFYSGRAPIQQWPSSRGAAYETLGAGLQMAAAAVL